MQIKAIQKQRRQQRVRARLQGTAERPRLTVTISTHHAYAQLIDDMAARTLAASTSVGQKLPAALTERAQWVGSDIAKRAKTAKISQVIFDRGSHRYHGRVKALAEAARADGLEF